MASDLMTLTEVAGKIGVAPKTIVRWEKAGKISRTKRDWRGWRVFSDEDVRVLEDIINSLY